MTTTTVEWRGTRLRLCYATDAGTVTVYRLRVTVLSQETLPCGCVRLIVDHQPAPLPLIVPCAAFQPGTTCHQTGADLT